ncbi:interleukin-1 receptor-associated kinase 1-binding protein 1 isoform X2 [Falco biarmicus]|uniref:interleukin-1 receptor-associated kinase 1-binding protein 1 isoform X2 n=1 Tax=Falco rusticolus TaxID=120794 RepID=UPI0018866A27|nr:interleukin-1 receptor-associated kinase 1-binding protein 1 isoform X2 [Falco rusticolus]XP_055666771.1 interleukin-1 receptor-associated kinase 1-binding protein 1 isoform X2 [Falco peregrinus]XP_056199954.1 interleukin-1 receptor-associated kinase 1-binding protein 1 isoform X2 [Falco biarmicus]
MVPEGPAAMALPAPPPARVFAELVPAPAEAPAPAGRSGPPALSGREVHVSGSAELSAGPDRARVSLRLGSRKGAAGAARSSVARRLEYIAQSARQRGVPVCIVFSDFGKMQNVCNLLIEKLGTSVTISPPHFYHTPEAIDTLRRRVCVAAVGNTRQKAQEVCRLFGQSLGKPLLIREEETKEWGGHIDSHLVSSPDSMTLQERIQNATAYASCKVFAVFEIKGKENRRNKFL